MTKKRLNNRVKGYASSSTWRKWRLFRPRIEGTSKARGSDIGAAGGIGTKRHPRLNRSEKTKEDEEKYMAEVRGPSFVISRD